MTSHSEKINLPNLRFPEFEGEYAQFELESAVQKKISYGIVQAGPHVPDGMPYIKSSDLNGTLRLENLERTSAEIAIKYRRSEVHPGDIIFSLRGNIGVSQILPATIPVANLTQGTARISASEEHSGSFIQQALNSQRVLKRILSASKGSTFQEISLFDLRKVPILLPSLPEQKKIAAFLGAVDEKLAALRKKRDLLAAYKRGAMQQIFSQKLRFTRDDGSAFPDWEEKTLGEVLTIGSGRDYKHLGEGSIPVYGTGGYMTSVDEWLHDGDSVCIGRKGTIDKPRFLSGKFWTVDTLFFTHSFKEVIPKFVYAIFQRTNWQKHNEASGVPSLSKATIESIKAPFPRPEEQQKITDFLSALDAKIDAVTDHVTQIEAFKKGLLQQMFV